MDGERIGALEHLHIGGGHVGKLEGIVPSADAYIAVHVLHAVFVVLRAQFAVRLPRTEQERPFDAQIDRLRKRVSARGKHLSDAGVHKLRPDAAPLDEHFVPFPAAHGIIDQNFGKPVYPVVSHCNDLPSAVCLHARLRQFFLYYNTAQKNYKAI